MAAAKKKRQRGRATPEVEKPKAEPKPKGKKLPGPVDYLKLLRATPEAPDGYGMFDGDDVPMIKEFLSSGVLAIDKICGGWPVGGIAEIAGWEHVGKSVILDQSIAQCQRDGGIAYLLDVEKGRTKKWSKMLGVDTSKLIVPPSKIQTLEEAFTEFDRVVDVQEQMMAAHGGKAPPMLIVWDSLGGMPSRAERTGGAGDDHMATAARVIKKNFRRLTQRLAAARVALVFANHFYNKIGGYGGIEAYGGSGVKYHTNVRLWLSRPESLRSGDKPPYGHVIRVKPKKNRVSGESGGFDTAMVYGAGIDNSYSLFEWGLEAKHEGGPWIERHGNWYRLRPPKGEPTPFQRKFLGLGEVLTAQPEVYAAMAKAYLEAA